MPRTKCDLIKQSQITQHKRVFFFFPFFNKHKSLCVIYFCFSLLHQITLSCSFLSFDCLCQISQSHVEFRKERKGKLYLSKISLSCSFLVLCQRIESINLSIKKKKKKKTQFPFTFFVIFGPKLHLGLV